MTTGSDTVNKFAIPSRPGTKTLLRITLVNKIFIMRGISSLYDLQYIYILVIISANTEVGNHFPRTVFEFFHRFPLQNENFLLVRLSSSHLKYSIR